MADYINRWSHKDYFKNNIECEHGHNLNPFFIKGTVENQIYNIYKNYRHKTSYSFTFYYDLITLIVAFMFVLFMSCLIIITYVKVIHPVVKFNYEKVKMYKLIEKNKYVVIERTVSKLDNENTHMSNEIIDIKNKLEEINKKSEENSKKINENKKLIDEAKNEIIE